jgi:outer membrane protein OmpU
MTNLKKIGLTALAGTLAATTFAQAGDLSVGGTARMEYQSTTTTTAAAGSNGVDTFAQNHTLVFSGSGEMDNGHTVSYMQALAGGTLTSGNVKVDMGDMGIVSMASHSFAGISTIADKTPNGGEEAWDDLDLTAGTTHGRPQDGVAQPHSGNRIGYNTTAGGVTVTAAANYEFAAPTTSIAVQMPNLVEGLNIGAGVATDQETEDLENDIETYFITYAIGSVSVGAQSTKIDHQNTNADITRDAYGISFAVNENFSIGYNVSDVDYDALANDEESRGFGASYTVGSMKVGFINNKKENVNGGTSDMEMNELQLTFAF